MSQDFEWREFSPQTSDYEGKIILLTGAAGGLGQALSRALAQLGSTVLMLDQKQRHLEKLFDQIVDEGGQEPVILPADLSQISGKNIALLADGIEQDFGRLDGLIHNAAELGTLAPLHEYDLNAWNKVMQVNVQATYLLTRSLLGLLQIPDRSSVIFGSAECGRKPAAFWGAYAIAYAATEAQKTLWHEELENTSNIWFYSLDPGPVRTAMRRQSHPGEKPEESPSPEELVNGYLALLANRNTALRGRSLGLQNPD